MEEQAHVLEKWSWYFGIPLVIGCVGEAVLIFYPEPHPKAVFATFAILVAIGVAGEVVLAIASWAKTKAIRELQRTIDEESEKQLAPRSISDDQERLLTARLSRYKGTQFKVIVELPSLNASPQCCRQNAGGFR
jgi:hypothetical protein